jgi:dihydrodipicolinate synthase/N-acetylneuraminate lyase
MRFRSDPANTIQGSIAPVVTPFTAEGQLDLEGLRALIAWQLDSGSHGISLGGSTGEPSAQSLQERIAAMEAAAEQIADRVPFLPGTGSAMLDITPETVARLRRKHANIVGVKETTRDLHYALHPLVDLIFTETNPAPAKWVLHQAGLLASAHVRPPLVSLSDAGQRKATELLRAGSPVLNSPVTALAERG